MSIEFYYNSLVGWLRILCDGDAITGLFFTDTAPANADGVKWLDSANVLCVPPAHVDDLPPIAAQCARELDEYFSGARTAFTVKTRNAGTPFRERCWAELLTIPYGQTRTYGEMAEAIGNKNAARAVGGANNKNNISIIYPCHRVIGADGALVGYGGGLWRKQWLLEFERNNIK